MAPSFRHPAYWNNILLFLTLIIPMNAEVQRKISVGNLFQRVLV